MHNVQHLATNTSPIKYSSSLSSASSELMSSFSSNGSVSSIKRRPHIQNTSSLTRELLKGTNVGIKNENKTSREVQAMDIIPPNNLSLHSLCSVNDSFLKDVFPFNSNDNVHALSNYEYCSYDSVSSSTNTQEIDSIDQDLDENLKMLSKNIRSRVEKLILSYKEVNKQAGKVHFINDLTFNFDENFTKNLFEIFLTSNFKGKRLILEKT